MKKRAARYGLTLIEVLITMVICTIALLATTQCIVASHYMTIKANCYNIANKAAGDAIAGYQANGYSALPTANSTNATTVSTGITGMSMTMTTTIGAPTFSASATNIKQIDIVVSWSGSGPSLQGGQVKASTLISAP